MIQFKIVHVGGNHRDDQCHSCLFRDSVKAGKVLFPFFCFISCVLVFCPKGRGLVDNFNVFIGKLGTVFCLGHSFQQWTHMLHLIT
jgi:hypothetical protein